MVGIGQNSIDPEVEFSKWKNNLKSEFKKSGLTLTEFLQSQANAAEPNPYVDNMMCYIEYDKLRYDYIQSLMKDKEKQKELFNEEEAGEIKKFFVDLQTDEDTKILARTYHELDGVPMTLETWFFDGIYAKSAIFPVEKLGELTPEEIIKKLETRGFNMKKTTVTKKEKYLFINFDFEDE